MKDLNLIPQYVIEEQNKKDKNQLLVTAGIIAVLFALVVIVVPLVQMILLNTQQKNIDGKIKQLENIQGDAQSVITIKKDIDDKGLVEQELQKSEGMYMDILTLLEQRIPKRVTILNVNISGKDSKITFAGVGKDDIAVADFINNLRKVESFRQIEIDGLSSNKGEEQADGEMPRAFSITLKYISKE